MKNIYYIGGSPCSGKSTAAEIIAKTCSLTYFKVDDHLDRYTEKGAADGKTICSKLMGMTPEQIWMRDPALQNTEELQFYQEIFEYIREDLRQIENQSGIITEGAAYLPQLIKDMGIDENHYVNITPTPEFQVFHFEQRPFIPAVLHGCTDEKQAFRNWMDRDILFADTVRRQAEDLGYRTFVTDGTKPVEELVEEVCGQFLLAGDSQR